MANEKRYFTIGGDLVEPGKDYRLRDGQKICITSISRHYTQFPIIGVMRGRSAPITWMSDGRFRPATAEEHQHDWDLMELWNKKYLEVVSG
ncbi:MAG: hypothetical protein V4721_00545 [Bacteroidota bacterium]